MTAAGADVGLAADELPRPLSRPLGTFNAYCPNCFPMWRLDSEPASDEQVSWTDDGRGVCADCGTQMQVAHGGWRVPLRSACLGCGVRLKGRQLKWCNQPGFGEKNLCAVAWAAPGELRWALTRHQEHLCGICCLPLDREPPAGEHPAAGKPHTSRRGVDLRWFPEVDHVVPLAAGGARTIDNLLAAHKACNQAKSDLPLAEARLRLGAGPEVVAARLASAGDHVRRMLTAPQGRRMHASLTDEIIAASKSR